MIRFLLGRYSLRTSLIVGILALLVPGMLLIGVFSSFQLFAQAQTHVNKEIEQSVASYSDLIDSRIDYYIGQLAVIACDPRLQSAAYDDPGLAATLEQYTRQTGFLTIMFADLSGNTSAGSQVRDRTYYIQSVGQGNDWLTSPIVSRSFDRTVLMASVPVADAAGNVIGALVAHIAIEDFYGILEKLVIGQSGYGFIVDSGGQLVAHPESDRVVALENMLEHNRAGRDAPGQVMEQVLSTADDTIRVTESFTVDNQAYYLAYTRIPKAPEGWILTIAVAPNEFYGGTWMTVAVTAVLMGLVLTVGVVISVRTCRYIGHAVSKIAGAAEQLATGDVDVEVEANEQNELGILSGAMRRIAEEIKTQSLALHTLAQGDYTVELRPRSPKDVMGHSFVQLVDDANRVMSKIRAAAGQVSSSSVQLLNAAQTLSTGATEQAASVQQFSASLELAHQHTVGNQESAANVRDVILETYEQFSQGVEALKQVMDSMSAIKQNAQNTAGIIKMIDEIAFETNILALNASVEAARAGEYGKGFVVVASEVRSLAEKSSAAARDTAELISGSIGMAELGSDYVSRTSEYMDKTTQYVQQCVEHTQKIADASEMQKATFAEITQSVQQISQIIQSNASVAEQTASAAQEMTTQAEGLYRVISHFKLHQARLSGEESSVSQLPGADGMK